MTIGCGTGRAFGVMGIIGALPGPAGLGNPT